MALYIPDHLDFEIRLKIWSYICIGSITLLVSDKRSFKALQPCFEWEREVEFWEHSQSERQLAYNCRTLLLSHRPQKFSVSIMKNTWTTKGLSLHALHFSAVKHVTQGSHQRQMNLQPKYRVLRKKSFGSVSYVGNFATYWSRCKNSSDFGVGFPHAHFILENRLCYSWIFYTNKYQYVLCFDWCDVFQLSASKL